MLDPFRFLLIAVAGWMNQPQQHAIEYLQEENRILRQQLGNRRLRITDDQRRSLAAKARRLGRRMLAELATIVRNTCQTPTAGATAPSFQITTTASAHQRRALELINQIAV